MFGKAQSTEVKAGQILVLIAIILKIVGIVVIFALNSVYGIFQLTPLAESILGGVLIAIGFVAILGTAAGIYAYQQAYNRKIRNAGIFAIIAALLPPLDIIMLIGAILFLVSSEGKK